MAKELLDYAQGYAVFQQVGGKTVPEHMRGNSLAHAGFVRGSRHDLANGPRMHGLALHVTFEEHRSGFKCKPVLTQDI
jgi:hypothetical protein